MLKLWLVKFSNGDVGSRPNGQHSDAVQEEWHIFGEKDQLNPHNWEVESITFLRAYRDRKDKL